jgi:hypothetical protein
MKRVLVLVVLAAAVGGLVAASAMAGKVNIPKEGSYEFDFCPIGQGKTFSNPDKIFAMQYDLNALLRTNPPGRAFDRMGARCYGLYTNLNGKQAETGICELTDLDGDKWWMDYHGNPDGAGGTYTSAGGTGKYDGMVVKGEYRIDNNWGSPSKDVAFLGCNPNKGTYRLK